MKLVLNPTEFDRLLTFWEDNMARSLRFERLETEVATLRTDLDELTATVAAGSTDFQPAIDALTERVDDLEAVVEVAPDAP